jgi:hypothetical protein
MSAVTRHCPSCPSLGATKRGAVIRTSRRLNNSKVQKLFSKFCRHSSLFWVHRRVIMDHRFGLLQEVHGTTVSQWLPMFLRKLPPEKLEPFCFGSVLGAVLSMDIDGLNAFVDHTGRVLKRAGCLFKVGHSIVERDSSFSKIRRFPGERDLNDSRLWSAPVHSLDQVAHFLFLGFPNRLELRIGEEDALRRRDAVSFEPAGHRNLGTGANPESEISRSAHAILRMAPAIHCLLSTGTGRPDAVLVLNVARHATVILSKPDQLLEIGRSGEGGRVLCEEAPSEKASSRSDKLPSASLLSSRSSSSWSSSSTVSARASSAAACSGADSSRIGIPQQLSLWMQPAFSKLFVTLTLKGFLPCVTPEQQFVAK